ncbi:hypothetical protein [Streptomyces sp. NPDC055287]
MAKADEVMAGSGRQQQCDVRPRSYVASIVEKLPNGHADRLASNGSLRLDQYVVGGVVEIREKGLQLSGRNNLFAPDRVALRPQVPAVSGDKLCLPSISEARSAAGVYSHLFYIVLLNFDVFDNRGGGWGEGQLDLSWGRIDRAQSEHDDAANLSLGVRSVCGVPGALRGEGELTKVLHYSASCGSEEMERTLVLSVIEDGQVATNHLLVAVLALAAVVVTAIGTPTVEVAVLVSSRGVGEEQYMRGRT